MYRKLLVFILLFSGFLLHAQDVSVMSFNIRYANPGDGDNAWEKRKELCAGLIRNYQPDIIGMQEVLNEQYAWLKAQLEDYHSFGRSRELNPDEGEAVPLFYRKDKYEVLSSGYFWLSDTPWVPGSNTWDAACNRMCTWGLFRNLQNGALMYVYNLHYDHVSEYARQMSSKLLLKKVMEIPAEIPFVIMGDLNASEENEAIQLIAKYPGIQDAYRQLNAPSENERTFNGWKKGVKGQRIDYIFGSRSLKVQKAVICRDQADGRFASDHYPVYTEFEFN